MNLIVLLLLTAQEDLRVLKPEDRPEKMLYRHLEAECAKHFEARRKEVAGIKTTEDLRKRQAVLKAKFIEALGGLPEKTPLHARTVGRAARDGYAIEKVVYESRPGHHVTATFYRPEGAGPFPAVLFPCGHFNNAKAAETYQRACILLAKHGIAALAFDPVGQGERVQLLTPEGKPRVGYGTSEHMHLGVAALLVGECAAKYFVWDGIRSLDYLESRPDVDAKRLGCLGNSGGGTQTAYLMALDERILAAVPNCYITSLERLFATIGPQDAEQNIPGQVAFGMEHADYVTMRAPRPTLISATTRDFFDIQGAWTTCREAKRIYGMAGHGERVDLFEFNDPHAISKPVRESALRWFRRWLLQVDDAPFEPDFAVAPDAELLCTSSGNIVPELKGKTAFDFVRERLGPRARPDREVVRRALRLEKEVAPAAMRDPQATVARDGWTLSKSIYEADDRFLLPALLAKPDREPGDRSLTVLVHGEGKAAAVLELEKEARAGRRAIAVDLRGLGETSPPARKGGWDAAFGAEWKETFLGLHLDRPLLGQRVKDLLSVLRTAGGPVRLVGIGAAGPVVLHAAALSEATLEEVRVERSLISWEDVVRNPEGAGHFENVVPGALAAYDLPDLALLIRAKRVVIEASLDALGKPVSPALLEETYAAARKAGVPLVLR